MSVQKREGSRGEPVGLLPQRVEGIEPGTCAGERDPGVLEEVLESALDSGREPLQGGGIEFSGASQDALQQPIHSFLHAHPSVAEDAGLEGDPRRSERGSTLAPDTRSDPVDLSPARPHKPIEHQVHDEWRMFQAFCLALALAVWLLSTC